LTRSPNKRDRVWIEISRKNLRHNLEVFRKLLAPRSTPIWVVKANAYGHGIELVAREIARTIRQSRGEWFAVDSIDEAIALRRAGIKSPVIILGYVPLARLVELPKLHVRYLVSSAETVRALAKIKGSRGVRVHIKIDTGTTRQGVMPKDAVGLAYLVRKSGLTLEGLATHFANVEDTDNPTYAHLQLERFVGCVQNLRNAGFPIPVVHAACSAAAMVYPESLMTAARVGIGLYGIDPSPITARAFHEHHRGARLAPLLSWRARVALVKEVSRGTPIGYGLTQRASRAMRVAIVPIGYADGFDRKLSSEGTVLIRGKRCPVVGRVCMNMIIVDVTKVRGVRQEDIATLIGVQGRAAVTAQQVAEASRTIPYEVVARLAQHLPRYLV
jgi:alanine racemase